MLLCVTQAKGMYIITNDYWKAGKEYQVQVRTNLNNANVSLTILDDEGNEMMDKDNIKKLNDGTYSMSYLVPSNEETDLYIIKATIHDDGNEYVDETIVRVEKMSWLRRMINIILSHISNFTI